MRKRNCKLFKNSVLTAVSGVFFLAVLLGGCSTSAVFTEDNLVRISKIKVDPQQLGQYTEILKEEMAESLRIEPGVLTLFAVTDKNDPSSFTILEIYADEEAYKSHIQSPHFKKYKEGTLEMVKELEIIDTVPLVSELTIKKQ